MIERTLLKYDRDCNDKDSLKLELVCTDGTTSNMAWDLPIQTDDYPPIIDGSDVGWDNESEWSEIDVLRCFYEKAKMIFDTCFFWCNGNQSRNIFPWWF